LVGKLVNQNRQTPYLRFITIGLVVIAMAVLLQTSSAFAGLSRPLLLGPAQESLDCPSQIELDIVDLINQERNDAGLPLFAIDMRLAEAARLHSEDMAGNNFFSHTGSDGSSLGQRLTRAGYPWRSAGENIAAGYRTVESTVAAWMGSDGHRANILSTRYDHIGLGFAYDQAATYGRYYTSDFGSSSDGVILPPDHCQSPPPAAVFSDVPADHWAHAYIEALYQEGYVAGCSTDPLMYCPEQTLNRAEIAVFLERGIHGASYSPSEPTSPVFADVPLWEWFAKWAIALWEDAYTAGCGTDPLIYCPQVGHTRAEGSVFFLRMLYGSEYLPPEPSGVFTDVPADSWYADWVEQAYEVGLIPACQTDPILKFFPGDPLDRAMAAYMMIQAKGLDGP
jgi:uncharacterized protein YkwD